MSEFVFFHLANGVFLVTLKVGRVIELLKTTTHNGFPVVDPLPEVEILYFYRSF